MYCVVPEGLEPSSLGLKVQDVSSTPENRTDDGIRTHDLPDYEPGCFDRLHTSEYIRQF
jgi:hypothetical protein